MSWLHIVTEKVSKNSFISTASGGTNECTIHRAKFQKIGSNLTRKNNNGMRIGEATWCTTWLCGTPVLCVTLVLCHGVPWQDAQVPWWWHCSHRWQQFWWQPNLCCLHIILFQHSNAGFCPQQHLHSAQLMTWVNPIQFVGHVQCKTDLVEPPFLRVKNFLLILGNAASATSCFSCLILCLLCARNSRHSSAKSCDAVLDLSVEWSNWASIRPIMSAPHIKQRMQIKTWVHSPSKAFAAVFISMSISTKATSTLALQHPCICFSWAPSCVFLMVKSWNNWLHKDENNWIVAAIELMDAQFIHRDSHEMLSLMPVCLCLVPRFKWTMQNRNLNQWVFDEVNWTFTARTWQEQLPVKNIEMVSKQVVDQRKFVTERTTIHWKTETPLGLASYQDWWRKLCWFPLFHEHMIPGKKRFLLQ